MTKTKDLIIRYIPDPCLRRKTIRIKRCRPELQELAEEMLRTMHRNRGVGLAANQVGLMERIAVVQTQFMLQPLVLINPEIIHREGKRQVAEGCLSIPGREEFLTRSTRIKVRATGLDGKQINITAEDLLAQIIEHETDHLYGVLYTDQLDQAKYGCHEPKIKDFL